MVKLLEELRYFNTDEELIWETRLFIKVLNKIKIYFRRLFNRETNE